MLPHITNCAIPVFTSSLALNVIFIFEKPQSRLKDNTKVYEGTMIESTKRGMECGIQLHWYCLVLIQLWVLMLWYLKEKINPIY
jgi:hypothetical protein